MILTICLPVNQWFDWPENYRARFFWVKESTDNKIFPIWPPTLKKFRHSDIRPIQRKMTKSPTWLNDIWRYSYHSNRLSELYKFSIINLRIEKMSNFGQLKFFSPFQSIRIDWLQSSWVPNTEQTPYEYHIR